MARANVNDHAGEIPRNSSLLSSSDGYRAANTRCQWLVGN
jgi:hypothetical protein